MLFYFILAQSGKILAQFLCKSFSLLWLSCTLVEEKPLCFTAVLYSFLFQMLISEVTGRIPFILSHNIRSGCSLISHPQKLLNLYPTQKSPPNPQNWHFEFDIRWRITLQRKFTSTIAALVHYQVPSSVNPQKRANFDAKIRN